MLSESQIVRKVRKCIVEALEVEPEEVVPGARLIGDLGAESVDLLDIVFRLERAFDVRIPRGGLEQRSRKKVKTWLRRGVLTKEALEALRVSMPEVDPELIQEGMRPRDIPRLFVVQTFVNLVSLQLEEAETSGRKSRRGSTRRRASAARKRAGARA